MDNIYSAILEAQTSGQSAALCTVIKSSGSVPRHSTSKMLVFADGRFAGTVGGGAMEQRIGRLLGEQVSWSAPHIQTGKSWAEVATTPAPETKKISKEQQAK